MNTNSVQQRPSKAFGWTLWAIATIGGSALAAMCPPVVADIVVLPVTVLASSVWFTELCQS